jgi:hypothetical protein
MLKIDKSNVDFLNNKIEERRKLSKNVADQNNLFDSKRRE